MADDKSLTNEIENCLLRNESITSGTKVQALGSPPQVTTGGLSRGDVQEIVQGIIKAELPLMLSKFGEAMNAILNRELQPINAKITAMVDSMKLMNSQYGNLLKEHAASNETIKNLQRENSDMKDSLKVRLDQVEQPTRSNIVEIDCLPRKKQGSESPKVVECVVENRDIGQGTRVAKLNPVNTRPRSIVVQLESPRVRDQLLALTINDKENKLNSTDVDYSGPKPTIYVMEHLSPTYRDLHAAARIKARELGYKFVWIRGGRIFVRKLQESENIMVRNMDTLNKLV